MDYQHQFPTSVLPFIWIDVSKALGKRVTGDFQLSYLQKLVNHWYNLFQRQQKHVKSD